METLRIEYPPWIEDFLKPARYKAAHGGRGSGKSHAFATMLIEEMVNNKDFKVVCIREIQKSLDKSVKALIESKIQALGVGDLFDVQRSVIYRNGGTGVCIFQGMQDHTAESIKSLEGFMIAWVEEAQSLSQRSLDLLRPTIRNEGSELWFTWNPYLDTDPIEFLRKPHAPEDLILKEVNWQDNPWFPSVLKEEMEYDKRRDIDKFTHVWEGGYVKNSETRVFKNWTIDEFEAPADAIFRFGADWGFAKDPTVLVRCFQVGRKLFIDYEAYMIGCGIDDTPDLFFTVPESEKWPIVADSARPETISYMRKHGFPKMMPAVKGSSSVNDGIEFLKSQDIVVHPRCKHTISELTHYSYKKDPHTEKILPILEDKDNHVIDAVRYALEAVRRTKASTKKVDFVPIPNITKW